MSWVPRDSRHPRARQPSSLWGQAGGCAPPTSRRPGQVNGLNGPSFPGPLRVWGCGGGCVSRHRPGQEGCVYKPFASPQISLACQHRSGGSTSSDGLKEIPCWPTGAIPEPAVPPGIWSGHWARVGSIMGGFYFLLYIFLHCVHFLPVAVDAMVKHSDSLPL